MTNQGNIRIGIAEAGIRHDMSRPPDLAMQFQLVKECGAFDYLDKTPPRAQLAEYARLSERFDLPILAGGWWYTLGRDEGLLAENIRVGAELGSLVHNVQIMMDHADGRLVTDQEVADAYVRAYDLGATLHCLPALEVHINMWSEDFRRVAKVAALVESRGLPFRITLDHSHVIFKINNDRELKVFGLDAAIAAGELNLDPFWLGGSLPCARHRPQQPHECLGRTSVAGYPAVVTAPARAGRTRGAVSVHRARHRRVALKLGRARAGALEGSHPAVGEASWVISREPAAADLDGIHPLHGLWTGRALFPARQLDCLCPLDSPRIRRSR